jgi:TIR domain
MWERFSVEWDFFVSYTQADRHWAKWIAWQLEEANYRVVVQAQDFVLGTNWIDAMHEGIQNSERTIAVLSGAYLESAYGRAEWQAAWAADPAGKDRKLVVVRVEDCDRPGLLAGVVGTDLFGLDEGAARSRLLKKVSDAITGTAGFTTRPSFPGASRAIPEKPRFPGALPTVWNVPAHNPNFTGRGAELAELGSGLTGGSTVTVEAVRGLGGVGKTQLAIEYAHGHTADYDLVWWVASEEAAAIPDQFTLLAGELGIEPATDPGMLRRQVHRALRDSAGWLLVFDNADSVADIEPWIRREPRLPGSPGHVIITTRRGGFRALGAVMDLDVIDLADAVELLRKRVPDLEQPVGESIAQELDRLPLALEQAAAYMDLTEMPGQEYLDLLRTRAADLYALGRVSSRDDTVATLWDLSLNRVEGLNQAAFQLLEICAYLAPEPVPLDLFTGHTDLLPDPLSETAADPVRFNGALGVLVDNSLAKRSTAGLQMHRLVQAACRARRDSTRLT